MRNRATAVLSLVLIVVGIVAITRTVQAGVGGGLGLILGVLLVAAGVLRLYLATISARSRPGKARPARKRRSP